MKLRTKAKVRAHPGKVAAAAAGTGLAAGAALTALAMVKGPNLVKLAAERLSVKGDRL
jgi:hypothetical protein